MRFFILWRRPDSAADSSTISCSIPGGILRALRRDIRRSDARRRHSRARRHRIPGRYFNTVGNYLLVRQSDAHAWSEIWLDGRGWVRVTLPGGQSRQAASNSRSAPQKQAQSSPWYQGGWILGLRNQFDLINRGWNSIVGAVQCLAPAKACSRRSASTKATMHSHLRADRIEQPPALPRCVMGDALAAAQARSARCAFGALCAKLSRAGASRAPAEGANLLLHGCKKAHACRSFYQAGAKPCSRNMSAFSTRLRYSR